MKTMMFAGLAAMLMSLGTAIPATAGKASTNRATSPTVAAKTTPRVSPRVDVANQVKAGMTGSKNFKNCKSRACLHSHQH